MYVTLNFHRTIFLRISTTIFRVFKIPFISPSKGFPWIGKVCRKLCYSSSAVHLQYRHNSSSTASPLFSSLLSLTLNVQSFQSTTFNARDVVYTTLFHPFPSLSLSLPFRLITFEAKCRNNSTIHWGIFFFFTLKKFRMKNRKILFHCPLKPDNCPRLKARTFQ